MSADQFYQQRRSLMNDYISDFSQQSQNAANQIASDNQEKQALANNIAIANKEIQSERTIGGSELIAGSAVEIPALYSQGKSILSTAKNVYSSLTQASEEAKSAFSGVQNTLASVAQQPESLADSIFNTIVPKSEITMTPFTAGQPREISAFATGQNDPMVFQSAPGSAEMRLGFGKVEDFTGAQQGAIGTNVPVLPTPENPSAPDPSLPSFEELEGKTTSMPIENIGATKIEGPSLTGEAGEAAETGVSEATTAIGDTAKVIAEDSNPVTAVLGIGLGLFGLVSGALDLAKADQPTTIDQRPVTPPPDLSNISAIAQEGI